MTNFKLVKISTLSDYLRVKYKLRMLKIFAVIVAVLAAASFEARAELGLSTRLRDDGSVVLQCKLSRKMFKRTRSSVLLIVRTTGEITKIRSRKKRCKFVQSLADGSVESYRVGVRLRNGQTTWSDGVAIVTNDGSVETLDEVPIQDQDSPNSSGSADIDDEDYGIEDTEEATPIEESMPLPEPSFDLTGNCTGDAALIMARRTNEARQAFGHSVLELDSTLMKSAHVHSQKMSVTGVLSHDGWYDVVLAFGWIGITAGQNIAGGYPVPDQAVQAFLDSPTHRTNIMSDKYTKIGIGCVEDSTGKRWWTQNFGG